ncbi:hypothetical protein QAD02_024003 [Eretmocerus hayati]|uniref:Uncharacterized protein n=1 Tax=Eretmocerus hayati TaxID=131215 RepID=A0ACC2PXI7_9HYME|nr:hypothetical protein QAD02_024003 [Eretmocerus hayati]
MCHRRQHNFGPTGHRSFSPPGCKMSESEFQHQQQAAEPQTKHLVRVCANPHRCRFMSAGDKWQVGPLLLHRRHVVIILTVTTTAQTSASLGWCNLFISNWREF